MVGARNELRELVLLHLSLELPVPLAREERLGEVVAVHCAGPWQFAVAARLQAGYSGLQCPPDARSNLQA